MATITVVRKGGFNPALFLPGNALTITPSDTDVYEPPVAVWVGTGGTVKAIPAEGTAVETFVVPDGCYMPCLVKAVYSTGTDAVGLVAI